MKKNVLPTVKQANIFYLMLVLLITIGGILLQPILGIGVNTCVNEIIYILFPVIILAKFNNWSFRNVYRFKKTSARNIRAGIICGICFWFFASYVYLIVMTLINKITSLAGSNMVLPQTPTVSTPFQYLFLIFATLILAPICEETFFRGFIQKAYEGLSPKYSFIFAGLTFGMLHILSNGFSQAVFASILGIALGYLVYSTDSILTSIAAHAAANTLAAIFGGIVNEGNITKLPYWFHIVAILGLFIGMLILINLKKQTKPVVGSIKTYGAKDFLYLAIAVIFLCTIGFIQILNKIGAL